MVRGQPRGFPAHLRRPRHRLPAPEGGPAAEAGQRACAGLTALVAGAWPRAESLEAADGHLWSDFQPAFAADIRERFPELPPAGVALAIRVWGRMHGLVALEIYGHLRPLTHDPAKLYRAEMLDLVRSLGLTPHS
ncbi:WHG domain-containing protein [Streptomyces syringium]|uniref:WHG domain-containing protein n=1 Tax=Streptomyces syringium TaxID=76729 RepID=UPI003D8B9824